MCAPVCLWVAVARVVQTSGLLLLLFVFVNFVVILTHSQGTVGGMFVPCQGFALRFQLCPGYLVQMVLNILGYCPGSEQGALLSPEPHGPRAVRCRPSGPAVSLPSGCGAATLGLALPVCICPTQILIASIC